VKRCRGVSLVEGEFRASRFGFVHSPDGDGRAGFVDDDGRYGAAQKLLEGRYAWLEEGIVDPSGDGPMIPPLD